MGRGFDITMHRVFNIYHGQGVRYTMDMRFDIPWVERSIYHLWGSIYHGYEFEIPLVRGSQRHKMGVDIPWIRCLIYHA